MKTPIDLAVSILTQGPLSANDDGGVSILSKDSFNELYYENQNNIQPF